MKMFGCGIRDDDDGVFLTCIYICEKEMCGSESESAVKVASVKAVIDCEKRCVEMKVDAVICILQI